MEHYIKLCALFLVIYDIVLILAEELGSMGKHSSGLPILHEMRRSNLQTPIFNHTTFTGIATRSI
jgi:hypothetical protein